MYTVRDILNSKGYIIHSIDPESTIIDALQTMAQNNIGALLVIKDKRVVGIFSERDYARKVVLKGKSPHESKVGEMMTEKIYYVKPSTSVTDCMKLMTDFRIRHLPVFENDTIAGIISIGDVVFKLIEAQNHTISQLEEYIAGKR